MVRKNGEYLGSKVFDLKRDAEAYELDLLRRYGDGVNVADGKRTVAELIPEFLKDREESGTLSPRTLDADKRALERLPREFTMKQVRTVRRFDIEKVLNDDARKYDRKLGGVQRYRASLSKFFTYLVEDREILAKNPVRGSKLPRLAPQDEKVPWLGDEIYERYKVWRSYDQYMADVAKLTWMLALRWGEVRGLKVGDVNLGERPWVHVQRSMSESMNEPELTKGKRTRKIPVAEELIPILEEWTLGRKPGEFLIPDLTLTKFRYRLRWIDKKKHTRKYPLDDPETGQGHSVHDLRHTGITAWVDAGIPLPLVQRWAGHAQISTTMGYTHLVGDKVNDDGIEMVNARNRRVRGDA